MSPALDIEPELLSRVNGAIADIRAGKMVILVDDEDRENEGDLCMAGELVTADAINFMATHGRGLICIALAEEQIENLQLPMMQSPGRGGPPLGTAFTVSIEARHGVTTGISAADRAHTTRVASDPRSRPEDLVTPGHVFPLKARKGGVLVRTGQTEGSVDLARLAGLTPAGVICEIMKEDGSMARMPDLETFSKKHGLRILTVADLIQYRLQTERLVKRTAEQTLTLDVTGTEWRAISYEVLVDGRQFLALVKGDVVGGVPPLCRVHAGSTIADTFASTKWDGGNNLREAIKRIEADGRGALVYLPPRGNTRAELEAWGALANASADTVPDQPLREFGLGAQVLTDLGMHKIRLLTNNPRKIAGIHGYGLDVVERVPLGVQPAASQRQLVNPVSVPNQPAATTSKKKNRVMSTHSTVEGSLIVPKGARFAIVASRFNAFIVEPLIAGALDALVRHGAEIQHITVVRCPGAWEMPFVAKQIAGQKNVDAIIAVGCVIRGSTPHFDYVAGEVAKGLASVSVESGTPIGFGVLTTDTIEQAIERAGTKAGNKGFDAAMSAIEMVSLTRALKGG